MLVDTHCHLFLEYYDDIQGVLDRARANDIGAVIVNGTNISDNKEVLRLVDEYEMVYGALGIQPEEIDDSWEDTLSFIEEHIYDNKIIAIGEIGLDYHYDNDRELQKCVFRKQLELAQKYNIPVIIHSRDCIQETYDILKEYRVRGILHCYSGSLEMARLFNKLGFYLGIGGICTFKNASKIVDVIKNIPLEYIVLETDSPYLSPEPYRGRVNEPSNIGIILEKICDIKCLSYKEASDVIYSNILALFDKKLEL